MTPRGSTVYNKGSAKLQLFYYDSWWFFPKMGD